MHTVKFSKCGLGADLMLFTIIGIEFRENNLEYTVNPENVEAMKELLLCMDEENIQIFYKDASRYGFQSIVLKGCCVEPFSTLLEKLRISEIKELSAA